MSYFTTTDPTTEELDYTSLDISETLLDEMVRENTTTTSPTAEDAELQNIEVRAPKKELTEAEKAERKERRKVEKKERREKARERDLAAKAEGMKGRGGVEMMKLRNWFASMSSWQRAIRGTRTKRFSRALGRSCPRVTMEMRSLWGLTMGLCLIWRREREVLGCGCRVVLRLRMA